MENNSIAVERADDEIFVSATADTIEEAAKKAFFRVVSESVKEGIEFEEVFPAGYSNASTAKYPARDVFILYSNRQRQEEIGRPASMFLKATGERLTTDHGEVDPEELYYEVNIGSAVINEY